MLLTLPSLEVTVGVPHASVAVAVPNAPLMSPADGLHASVVVVPPVVSTGGVLSAVTVKEALQVAVPQEFVAVKITVVVPPHLFGPTLPPLFVDPEGVTVKSQF